MKPKRKLWYEVSTIEVWWWYPKERKWVRTEYPATWVTSVKRCRTFDQACKIARKVPSGVVIITQRRWKKGWYKERDYFYEVLDSAKKRAIMERE